MLNPNLCICDTCLLGSIICRLMRLVVFLRVMLMPRLSWRKQVSNGGSPVLKNKKDVQFLSDLVDLMHYELA